MNQNFKDFMGPYQNCRLAVAVSGGVDSVALLHWLAELGLDITVVHVNHGLRPAAGTEARTARYRLITDFCKENDIGHLVVAHQADDQIETFLMNLARGSGVTGLAGMRAVSFRDGICILRPLLQVSRADLQKYCDDNKIKYFHDEMNDDMKYARVRVRHNRHVLREMLGISDSRILLAMQNLGRVRDAAATDVFAAVSSVMDGDRAIFSDSFLFDLGRDIRLQFIAALIMKIGGGVYQPRLKSLEAAENRLKYDCKFTLGRCVIRRLGARILITREGARTSFRKRHESRHSERQKIIF